MVTMINVFSYGFIILISLVCVCNIFNTVSTNIALRRRDFGMLRSIGMEECQIRRMLFVECFSYGRTALLIGIPLGLLCGWGLLGISYNVEEVPYTLPLAELCVAVGTIFLVIFASMTYALSKLKKDDPIEAIRMDNI
jgi:putative ABC transport system permease protein